MPPGFHVIENGSMPADTRDKRLALERKVVNLITPETKTSSHYFWAIVRGFRLDDQALDEVIRDGIVRTFDQDKAILEAQQRALGPDPDNANFPVSIRVDAGPTQGRRLLRRMIESETEPSGRAPAALKVSG
jgi:vanillate O-demethylase monooxygenase subunit